MQLQIKVWIRERVTVAVSFRIGANAEARIRVVVRPGLLVDSAQCHSCCQQYHTDAEP